MGLGSGSGLRDLALVREYSGGGGWGAGRGVSSALVARRQGGARRAWRVCVVRVGCTHLVVGVSVPKGDPFDERLPVVRGAAGSHGWVNHGALSDRALESRRDSLRRKCKIRGPDDGLTLQRRTSGYLRWKISGRTSRDRATATLPEEDKGSTKRGEHTEQTEPGPFRQGEAADHEEEGYKAASDSVTVATKLVREVGLERVYALLHGTQLHVQRSICWRRSRGGPLSPEPENDQLHEEENASSRRAVLTKNMVIVIQYVVTPLLKNQQYCITITITMFFFDVKILTFMLCGLG